MDKSATPSFLKSSEEKKANEIAEAFTLFSRQLISIKWDVSHHVTMCSACQAHLFYVTLLGGYSGVVFE